MGDSRLVVIVPGLAVRSYAEPAAAALRAAGYRVALLRAPAWRRTPATLARYGDVLAARLAERGEKVDLLVGLSVGSQSAALAASKTPLVGQLLLVSPTVDPRLRSLPRLVGRWLRGDDSHTDPSFGRQVRDWLQAGIPRICVGFVSTLRLPIEASLSRVCVPITVVHPEHDYLGSVRWARSLAALAGARYLYLPGAGHSWPVNDADGFRRLVDELLTERTHDAPRP